MNENDFEGREIGSPEFEAIRLRVLALAPKHGLPFADYLVELFEHFEPEAYAGISDADLIEDIRAFDNELFPGIYPK